MTTLAERQDWLRAGCPVPPEPETVQPCRSFTFRLCPGTVGVLIATCGECGAEWRAGGITLGEHGDTRVMGDGTKKIKGGEHALKSLCAWADSHTKVENVQPTYDAIKGDNRWHDAAIWLRRLMNVQEATMCLAGAKVDGKYRAVLAADPIKELAE